MTGKQLFVRSALTLALPWLMIWTFFSVLLREVASAFRYAWLQVLIEYEMYVRELRRGDY